MHTAKVQIQFEVIFSVNEIMYAICYCFRQDDTMQTMWRKWQQSLVDDFDNS